VLDGTKLGVNPLITFRSDQQTQWCCPSKGFVWLL
jgi:hypothetical protein